MNLECSSKTTKISVFLLGGALFMVMLAYMVFGDTNDQEGLRNLRMVSILFRHGDRTPTELYPKDPHSSYEWPGGLGALTQKGSLQMYNLGKNLKLRYYRLLPKNSLYSKQEMYVHSSAAERCLMSAQSLLAGFLPPLEHQNILPIPWQPIAINLTARLDDAILAQKKPCKRYDEILKKLYSSPPPDLEALNRENKELYEKLSKYTGQNISNVLHVELLYNILEVERDHGLELPDWTENIFPEKMLPLAERSYALFTETPLMKKVKGGAFITEVHNQMINKRKKILNQDRKVFLYSGHDVTMVNVMNSLNILDQTSRKPEYASALVFELHHSVYFRDDFEVKLVYYFNSEDKFPKEISIPHCDTPCSLTEFSKVLKNLIIDNFDELCENVKPCKT
ncbi:lysosomal acid phosphatase [Condylostylus longicornis]|uniref:lysosomal acid phosphatase n=1 Tax=Condylostylus longicornis TaxID=2530218 RepID=UPI00244E53BE|nr:lysosomal acid phosphatase [Condylostylus longicornis]